MTVDPYVTLIELLERLGLRASDLLPEVNIERRLAEQKPIRTLSELNDIEIASLIRDCKKRLREGA